MMVWFYDTRLERYIIIFWILGILISRDMVDFGLRVKRIILRARTNNHMFQKMRKRVCNIANIYVII